MSVLLRLPVEIASNNVPLFLLRCSDLDVCAGGGGGGMGGVRKRAGDEGGSDGNL
jgi:predicted Rossmann-fold nucleotide-binding protein